LVLKHARDPEVKRAGDDTDAVFRHEFETMEAVDRLNFPVPIPLTRESEAGNPYFAYLIPRGPLAGNWWDYYGDRLPGDLSREQRIEILTREAGQTIGYMIELSKHGWRQSTYAAITHGVPYDWAYIIGQEDGTFENTSLHNALSGTRYGNIRREGIHADFDGILPLAPPRTSRRVHQIGQGLTEIALLTLRSGEENGLPPEESAGILSSMLEKYARRAVPASARAEMDLPKLRESVLVSAKKYHDYWLAAHDPSLGSRIAAKFSDIAIRAVSLNVHKSKEDVIMDGGVISPLVLDGIRPLAEAAAGFRPAAVIGIPGPLRRFAYFIWSTWPNELGMGKPGAFLSAGLILASITAAVQAPSPLHFMALAAAATLQTATAYGRISRFWSARRTKTASGPWIRIGDPNYPASPFASTGKLFPRMTWRGALYALAIFTAFVYALFRF
jgi:hypothetical protein